MVVGFLEVAQSLGLVTLLLSVVITVCHFAFSPKVPRIELTDARVLITGGSTGIGLETAKRCIRKGASVIIVARNAGKLQSAHSELSELCTRPTQTVFTISAEVSDFDALQTAVDAKLSELEWDWLSAIVCNAGVELLGRLVDTDIQDYRRVMNVNFFGTLNTIKVCLPLLQSKNSTVSDHRRIVIVSSMLGVMGLMFYSGYSASKHALSGLAQSLSHELRAFDIYTCIVYPPDTKVCYLSLSLSLSLKLDCAGQTDSYAREAEVYMPEPVRAISKDGGVFEASEVGADIADAVEHGRFITAWGLDGWLVTNLTAGMTMPTTLINSLFQGLFGGIVRLVGMFYASEWCKIAQANLGYTDKPSS